MARKTMSETTVPPPSHSEAKGLAILGLSFFFLLCLLSYEDGNVKANWLGALGYYTAFIGVYLFGLGSFALVLLLSWIGWQKLTKKTIEHFKTKLIYFSICLASCMLLLNVGAEIKAFNYPLLNSHVFSESTIIKGSISYRNIRYNLGGVPFYFLYRDLAGFNLQSVLSDIGIVITFSLTLFVSLILLLEVSFLKIVEATRQFLHTSRDFIVNLFKKPIPLQEEFEEEEQQIPLSLPNLKRQKLLPSVTPKEKPIAQLKEPTLLKKALALVTSEAKQKEIKIHEYREEGQKIKKKTKFESHSKNYQMPPLSLLSDAAKVDIPSLEKDLRHSAEVLEETLLSFGIEAKVGEINCGPTITSFDLHPAVGVKVQKIKALENDIALNLQAKSIRIIAPIPGKAAVGVEVPSPVAQEVGFKDMLYAYYQTQKKCRIPILLGKTVSGENVVSDLTKMPHCLIAGATGSGKSVCINTIIMSILMTSHPDDIKLILIDPKKVELTPFTKLPHMIAPVITEAHGAYAALNWLVKEMQHRYEILKLTGQRNISAFNHRKIDEEFESSLEFEIPDKMCTIVAIIDEFADLMMTSSADLETPIARIAQMARAVGIHLILATQRPSREVITGLIKANFPTRIAFKVASRINSQIIIDENGAESLLGNGDMLFLPPGSSQLLRAQGAYLRDEDINKTIDYILAQSSTNYLIKSFDEMHETNSTLFEDAGAGGRDAMYQKALQLVLSTRTASTTYLQRKLKVGYARAASLMDELEESGVIGPQDGAKPRKVIASNELLSQIEVDSDL